MQTIRISTGVGRRRCRTLRSHRAPTTEPLKLLIVDDDHQVLRASARILHGNWDIETANSALEAVDLLEEKDFDAILTDYEMPGENGVWLLNEVRRSHPKTRRVLLSGSEPENLTSHICSGLIDCFVSKPASRAQLIESFTK